MEKQKVTKEWRQYSNGVDYKKKIKLLKKCDNNERFYSGDQWYSLGAQAKELPKTQVNIIKQIAGYKKAQVLSEDLTFLFTPQDFETSDEEEENGQLKKAYDAFNAFGENLKEDADQEQLNDSVLQNAMITGGGGIYYYWDTSVKKGNKVKSIGEVRGISIDSTTYYPCDPNNSNVQSQDWVIIIGRESVKKLRLEAKSNGIKKEEIDKIVSDEDTENLAFEYDRIQETEGKKATTLLKLWRADDGMIHFNKSTKLVQYKKDTPTGLENYPIAWINWENKKSSAFGISEVEALISNQVALNKILAFSLRNHALTGFPKLLVNKAKVSGGLSNKIGGILEINTDGNIRDAASYLQPPTSSAETYKLFDTLLQTTKDVSGANENALGESPAQNASAIIALQKQSGIPLENIRRNYKFLLKQVARVYEIFFKSYYTETRGAMIENKKTKDRVLVKFNASEFTNLNFDVKIDVGVGSRFSEILVMEQLQGLKDAGDITVEQYLDYIPKNVLPQKDRILEDLKDSNQLNQVEEQLIQAIMQLLPPEQAEELMAIEDPTEFKLQVLSLAPQFIAQPQAEGMINNEETPT